MNESIGKEIGVVTDKFKITNDAGEVVDSVTVKFDFSTVGVDELKVWLVGNRKIALQGQLRKLSKEEIEEFSGSVVLAQNAGRKIESKEEQLRSAKSTINSLDEETKKALVEELLSSMES